MEHAHILEKKFSHKGLVNLDGALTDLDKVVDKLHADVLSNFSTNTPVLQSPISINKHSTFPRALELTYRDIRLEFIFKIGRDDFTFKGNEFSRYYIEVVGCQVVSDLDARSGTKRIKLNENIYFDKLTNAFRDSEGKRGLMDAGHEPLKQHMLSSLNKILHGST